MPSPLPRPDAGGAADRAGADPAELRDLAVDLARRAGDLLMQRRASDLELDTKSTPTDLVTVMDGEAEQLVVSGLRQARPDDAILAEESGARAGSGQVRWIVDPLDGTVNYAYGIGVWGVSIAAELSGTVIAGAVFSALDGGVYEAFRGGGARFEGEPLRCSGVTDLALSLLGTGFSYSAARRTTQGTAIAALLPAVRDIRRMGAAALDLCAVARGTFDAYFEYGLQPWDRAAGLLIAEEAGAGVTTFPFADADVTIAAAPGIFDALSGRIRELHPPA